MLEQRPAPVSGRRSALEGQGWAQRDPPNHQCAQGRPARPAGAATGGRPGQILTGRGRGRGDCMQPRPEIRAETPRAPLRTESSRRMLETNRVCRRAYSSQPTSVAGQLVAETIRRLRDEAAKREVQIKVISSRRLPVQSTGNACGGFASGASIADP